MNDIGSEMIKNSFKVCGKVPRIEVNDIRSCRDGKTCSSGRAQLKSLWYLDCERIDIKLICIKLPEDILEVPKQPKKLKRRTRIKFQIWIQYPKS